MASTSGGRPRSRQSSGSSSRRGSRAPADECVTSSSSHGSDGLTALMRTASPASRTPRTSATVRSLASRRHDDDLHQLTPRRCTAFWDENGYDALTQRMRQSSRTLEELRAFYKEKCALAVASLLERNTELLCPAGPPSRRTTPSAWPSSRACPSASTRSGACWPACLLDNRVPRCAQQPPRRARPRAARVRPQRRRPREARREHPHEPRQRP